MSWSEDGLEVVAVGEDRAILVRRDGKWRIIVRAAKRGTVFGYAGQPVLDGLPINDSDVPFEFDTKEQAMKHVELMSELGRLSDSLMMTPWRD